MKALCFDRFGGPEVLEIRDLPDPAPAPGEALGGDPKPVDPRMLMDSSKTLTGGDLWNVLTSAAERRTRARQLFDWLEAGQLTLSPPTVFPLVQGADAHRLLESRRSTGKVILIP